MGKALRLAIFDLDGTLVDSRASIARSTAEVARILGVTCPPLDAISRIIGLSFDESLARLFPGVEPETHQGLMPEYLEAFARLRANVLDDPLFDGTLEVLRDLAGAGMVLGIATGKPRRGVARLLETYAIEHHFSTIQTPDTALGKPHPDMVLRAMADVGAAPSETVMIGDTTFDIEMALAAGVRPIGVAWGNHPARELEDAGAYRLVDRMTELAQAVQDVMLAQAEA